MAVMTAAVVTNTSYASSSSSCHHLIKRLIFHNFSSPSISHRSVMPDSDEHENDIYEDEEVELSDDDPPLPKASLKGLCDQNIKYIWLWGGEGGLGPNEGNTNPGFLVKTFYAAAILNQRIQRFSVFPTDNVSSSTPKYNKTHIDDIIHVYLFGDIYEENMNILSLSTVDKRGFFLQNSDDQDDDNKQ